jgi:iron complex transport system ATP-binding protein
MLKISHVDFNYDQGPHVLSDVSFDIESGQIVGILGPNGSGKTTLLHVIAGLLKPKRGNVSINNEILHSFSAKERAKQIALVLQDDHLSLPFVVRDVVAMGRAPYQSLFSFDSSHDLGVVQSAIKATGIDGLDERSIIELSGGEQRRVFIARALAQETPLLLLDEPTAHLDIRYQLEIFSLCRTLASEGRTMIITVHDINMASMFCERIILLKDGKLHSAGRPSEVITSDILQDVYGIQAIIKKDSHDRPYCRISEV